MRIPVAKKITRWHFALRPERTDSLLASRRGTFEQPKIDALLKRGNQAADARLGSAFGRVGADEAPLHSEFATMLREPPLTERSAARGSRRALYSQGGIINR